MRIGLLSDTHSYWDDKYKIYFSSCEEIWHAGDIGDLQLADKLAEIAPLKAVVGNIDGADLRRSFPKILRWTCEGVDILMTHIGGYPSKYDGKILPILKKKSSEVIYCRTFSYFKSKI